LAAPRAQVGHQFVFAVWSRDSNKNKKEMKMAFGFCGE